MYKRRLFSRKAGAVLLALCMTAGCFIRLRRHRRESRDGNRDKGQRVRRRKGIEFRRYHIQCRER